MAKIIIDTEIQKTDGRASNGGGFRNQGRKAKFQEETTTLAFRVPLSKKEEIKIKVEKIIRPYFKTA